MKKSVLLTLFTALLFSSCNLTLDGTPRGSGAGNGSIPSEETNVKINFGREALLYEGEADPRYVILPNFSSLNSISDYGIQKIKVYVDSTTQDFNISPGQTSIELRITQESHTIKLEGLDGSDKVVLKSDDWTGNITSGIVVPLGLKPFSQDASATDKGSVKLTINFPAKTSTITEYYVKCDVDGTGAEGDAGTSGEHVNLLSSVQGKTFTITDLDPGTHHVNITISKNSSFNGNATISFNAIVYAGLESSTVYDHSAPLTSDITYTHSDFETVTINDYAVCVKGTESIFVSEAENSAANDNLIPGTKHCIVYDTLADALSFVSEASGWTDASEITIYINGTVTETPTDGSMVNISMSGKTLNLVGFKPASKPVAVLDADGNGRVLKVSSGNVVIKDLTLTGGNADNGGGIYCNTAGVKITLDEGALVTTNTATTNGGGIYFAGTNEAGGTANLIMNSTSQISGNTATSSGGGVYLSYANLCMSGKAVVGDTKSVNMAAQGSNSFTLRSNQAANGGGVYLDSGAALYIGYSGAGSIAAMDSGYGVRHNYASSNGGGIYVSSGSSVYMGSGCVAKNGAGANGGGICSEGNVYLHTDALVGDSTSTVAQENSNNSNAAQQGGGIWNSGTLKLGHNGSSSTALNDGKGVVRNLGREGGGGIYNSDGSTEILSGVVSFNLASAGSASGTPKKDGGGINCAGGSLTISGGTIAVNSATGKGGGVAATGGTFSMTGGTIGDASTDSPAKKESNSYSNWNGGLWVNVDNASVTGGTIAYNYGSMGGGIDLWGTNLTINGNVVIKCNGGEHGGGLCIRDGKTAIITKARFEKNEVSSQGGAIYFYREAAVLKMDDVSFPDSSEKHNDIFLNGSASNKISKVTMTGAGPEGGGAIAAITPHTYDIYLPAVIDTEGSGVNLATVSQRFSLTPNTSDTTYTWLINTNGKLKQSIGTKLAPTEVGDIVYSDGSASPSSVETLNDTQKGAAAAVIFSVSGSVKKGVGLQESSTKLKWVRNSTQVAGCNIKLNTSDTDGSGNWAIVQAADPDGAANVALDYPAFYYANTYGVSIGGVSTGWYIPAKEESISLWDVKDVMNAAFGKIGAGATILNLPDGDGYWTSSQCPDKTDLSGNYSYVWNLEGSGQCYDNFPKNTSAWVRPIRKF